MSEQKPEPEFSVHPSPEKGSLVPLLELLIEEARKEEAKKVEKERERK